MSGWRTPQARPSGTVSREVPDGREVPLQYPATPLMDAVVKEVLSGTEYPPDPLHRTRTGRPSWTSAPTWGCSAIIFATQISASHDLCGWSRARDVCIPRPQHCVLFPPFATFRSAHSIATPPPGFFLGRGGSVTSSLFAGKEAFDTAGEMVPIAAGFSSFLKEQSISRISVLKIDTEGRRSPFSATWPISSRGSTQFMWNSTPSRIGLK